MVEPPVLPSRNRAPAGKPRTRAIGRVELAGGETATVDVDTHVGRLIRRRRRLLGLSQSDLAQACGIGFQQIQKYECGAARLSVARLWVLAGALGADLAEFFQGLPKVRRADAARASDPATRSFAPRR